MIHTHTVKHTVRSCKINVFEHTSCLLFYIRQTHALIGFDAILRNGNNLARLHITDKLRINGSQGTAFGYQNVGILLFTDAERLKAKRISGADHLARAHDDQGVSTLDLLHGIGHGLLNRRRAHTLSCDMVRNDLRINGSLENSAAVLQLSSQFRRIDQVSVVGQRQSTLYIVEYQRLGVLPGTASRSGVTHMSHTNISM